VKRQDLGEMFASYKSDKGLMPKTHKEFEQLNSLKNNLQNMQRN
jgi:hypothetical protein